MAELRTISVRVELDVLAEDDTDLRRKASQLAGVAARALRADERTAEVVHTSYVRRAPQRRAARS